MYSNLKSVQILLAMLKEYNIDTVVISPGTSHDAIVRSFEDDPFFKTYNIVDERSAAFFAIGLIEQLNRPVAVCCTSGTATSNYLTAVTEASRRGLPLIIISGDKNPYYLAQYEDQVIDQLSIFRSVTRYQCQLPMVKDDKDFWYCNRIINEALLELDHHGTGPVQIDVPIEEGMFAIGKDFAAEKLPQVTVIKRISMLSDTQDWAQLFGELANKKVMLICGQDENTNDAERELIKKIAAEKHYVFAIDKISNLQGCGTLEITGAVKMYEATMHEYTPDIVISFAGNTALDYKFKLKAASKQFKHWIVNKEGRVADPYKNLNTVIEANTLEFLQRLDEYGAEADSGYANKWIAAVQAYSMPEAEYSNLYAVSNLMKRIPAHANLSLANSSTIRLAQYCELDDSVRVFCNRGVSGIDGCMSSFIGNAALSGGLSFLIIGDLTFFYDMNGIWNRYVGKNVRIMLNNNEGAALFHFNQGLDKYPGLNENVAAEHFAAAKGWVEGQGFRYLSAHTKEEFDANLELFLDEASDMPIFFEVFTKKENDAKIQHDFFDSLRADDKSGNSLKSETKKVIKSLLGEDLIKKLRKK